MTGSGIPGVIRLASDEIRDLTGRTVVCVNSLAPSEPGWLLGLERLEREAVPDTMDVLAIHEAHLDARGHVRDVERKALRHRGGAGET